MLATVVPEAVSRLDMRREAFHVVFLISELSRATISRMRFGWDGLIRRNPSFESAMYISDRTLRAVLRFYSPAVYRPILIATALIALFACTKNSDEEVEFVEFAETGVEDVAGPTILERGITATTAEDGTAEISFLLPEGISAFQVIAHTGADTIRVVHLTGPDGRSLWNGENTRDQALSQSWVPQPSPVTFNFPLLGSRPLAEGSYRLRYEVENIGDESIVASDISATVLIKKDLTPESGVLLLNVVYSDIIADSKISRDGVEAGLNIAVEILRNAGIESRVNISRRTVFASILPDPELGDPMYQDFARDLPAGINLFFGVDADGLSGPRNEISLSGANPGPALPSPRSAIVISVSKAAGNDGEFDSSSSDSTVERDSEIRYIGEAIAHETLHYLGLRDTVTFDGNLAVSSDLLDSEKCPTVETCQENLGASENIMFPYPLRDDESDDVARFFPRDRVSTQQRLLAHRHLSVR